MAGRDGGEQLRALAHDLKAVAAVELRRELGRALGAAVRPLRNDVRAAARATLPRHGGLNEVVAKAPIRVKTRLGNDPGVSLVGRGHGLNLHTIDTGVVHHATFGHDPVVAQRIPAGWWTRTLEAKSPAVEAAVVQVMDDISRKLERHR